MQILLVAMCFAILMGTNKSVQKLEIYLEQGVFNRQLTEKKAESWLAWLSNLKTRQVSSCHDICLLLYGH